ncbi:hypothetical protein [Bifidobacterium choloepi]|uniref:Uncharacterized protein n=1 Tax=Bifidobacterium choloepi TaxID=2614131 RepID=A0A6I5MYM9_9BIFI|nr:hypothetical protein [Bifidobacterium choloepi]NEG69377.1 hypothetical protein [Bifidobacterium choloepi]
MNHPYVPGQSAVLALDTGDLKALPRLDLDGPIVVAIVAALVVAVALVVAAVLLSRQKRPKTKQQPAGAHAKLGPRDVWKQRIAQVVADYDDGDIDREEAFARLATVARRFASAASGTTVTSHTLLDLNRDRTVSGAVSQDNWTLFRQTIAALYPPEFADNEHHRIARDATVDQAAGWVLALVEKWR